MSKLSKEETTVATVTEDLAFDMIELMSDELQNLTRAFDVIEKVCKELNGLPAVYDNLPIDEMIH